MTPSSFPGDELRVRRMALGLTVDDVYRKLRIPLPSIRAFEEGRLADLPAMCYSSGFLKTYCEFLGVDPGVFLDCLKEFGRPATRLEVLRGTIPGSPRPAWMQSLASWTAITAVLLLGWVTYAVVFQPAADNGRGRIEASEPAPADSPGERPH